MSIDKIVTLAACFVSFGILDIRFLSPGETLGGVSRYLAARSNVDFSAWFGASPACRSSKEPRPLSHKTLFA
jgi:hypothetical protein